VTEHTYDLVVIGGGAAGLGAARAAVERRARPLLISDGPPGGDCTFYGCVPSKTLIESAKAGLRYEAAVERIRTVVSGIAATENADALAEEGIEVRLGAARFAGPGRVDIGGDTVAAPRVVIATGSRPAVPAIPGLEQVGYLTNETIFDLASLPATLAVLGGGAVGCELAQAFARLGTEVTVLETADRLLPAEEPEASQVLETVFAREGIDVRLGARIERAETTRDGQIRLTSATGDAVTADRLLVATGRVPVTDGLDLGAAGIRVDSCGCIATDDRLACTAPRMFAAGDVTGRMLSTHAAYEMGRIAAQNALGGRRRYRTDATPRVTFTDPEIAQVGLTEAQSAQRRGRVAYLPMSELDRALAAGETDGYIKLVAGPRALLGNLGGGRVLGATIVASRAGELIHEPTLAIATGMFTGRLAATTHAYPTWSYGVQLAAAQFFLPIGGRRARPAR
jgi:pyruvate/2-oxoglutarate dehydrogenase complex dihydrolipoamide dehydrogenase (E3) component